jgi:hypothetical protein
MLIWLTRQVSTVYRENQAQQALLAFKGFLASLVTTVLPDRCA